ncbi:FtsX-like permease family protein [Microbacterium phyllosphaerae]|uniref:FtsX-like permease family protein n=1 Tax=Microbacterium phyllosphaerae TaxID=124798 RepID=UPI00216799D9|nr:FtsX-like permease family protein [Microbacterium phyllosphaerae]MCS3442948.1 hypothetical protein [Microbacterium phyllosphaerae]
MRRASALARWLIPSLVRANRTLVVLAVLGIAVFGTLIPLASDTADSAATTKEGLGAAVLRAIMISPSIESDAQGGLFHADDLAEVRAVEGIESAVGWAQTGIEVSSGSMTVGPFLTPRFSPLQPPVTHGREPVAEGEILLAESDLDELGADVGAVLTARHDRYVSENIREGVAVQVTVVGAFDDAFAGLDGDDVAYALPEWVDSIRAIGQGVPADEIQSRLEYLEIYAVVDSADRLSEVVDELRGRGYVAGGLGALLSAVQPVQAALQMAKVVLGALLVVFLLVVGGGAAAALVGAKRAEIGVLRAFGWRRGLVLWAFVAQFALLGAVIAVSGATLSALGAALLALVFPTGVFGLPLVMGITADSVAYFSALLFIPPLAFAAAALLPACRAASIPPDEVLRDVGR